MTSKERAYLAGLAQNLNPILHLGKNSLTPEMVSAVDEALEKRELIKINVLKNCDDDIKEIANTLAGRTRSNVVQVIGRRIVLYRESKNEKNRNIVLPRTRKKSEE